MPPLQNDAIYRYGIPDSVITRDAYIIKFRWNELWKEAMCDARKSFLLNSQLQRLLRPTVQGNELERWRQDLVLQLRLIAWLFAVVVASENKRWYWKRLRMMHKGRKKRRLLLSLIFTSERFATWRWSWVVNQPRCWKLRDHQEKIKVHY